MVRARKKMKERRGSGAREREIMRGKANEKEKKAREKKSSREEASLSLFHFSFGRPPDILGRPTPLPAFLSSCPLCPFFFFALRFPIALFVGLVFLGMRVFLRVSRVFERYRYSSGS